MQLMEQKNNNLVIEGEEMNVLKYVPEAVTSTLGRQVLVAQKHSPTILFVGGIVGIVTTVVLASRATLQLEDCLKETQDKLTKEKELKEALNSIEKTSSSTEEKYKQDVLVIYTHSVIGIAKLYGPAVVLGVLSIAALTKSHTTLSRRNAGLMAAYAALEKGFAEYRSRVLKAVGPDVERELRYGTENYEIETETKKGMKVLEKTRVSPDGSSIYAKFFDKSTSSEWSPDPTYNYCFLKSQQDYANHLLQSRGHVFLNDVYDSLRIERTIEGQVVGWVKNNGDNYVDFGDIFDDNNIGAREFFSGRNNSILLDFNVDGVVYDLI